MSPGKTTTPEDMEKLGEVLKNIRFALMKHLSEPERFAGKNEYTFTDQDFQDMAEGLIERLAHAASCWEFGDKATTVEALKDARERIDCLLIIVNGKDV
jgi:hypothetical protein